MKSRCLKIDLELPLREDYSALVLDLMKRP